MCQLMGKTSSQHQNGRIKFTHNNINLNVNRLSDSIKRHRLTNWTKSRTMGVLYSANPSLMQGYTKAQNKGMDEDLPSKWRAKKRKKEKAGVAILVSDKIDFKPKKIKRDKEGHLHNDKRINATRRAKDPKYICTQYSNTQIQKGSS